MFDKLCNVISTLKIHHKTAIVEKNNFISYEELLNSIIELSLEMTDRGIKKGDHVGLVSENSSKYIIYLFSLQKIGAVVIPISKDMKTWELRNLESSADIDYVISRNTDIPNYNSAFEIKKTPGFKLFTLSFKQEKNTLPGVSIFLTTSGSTSSPKIVMHSSEALIKNALSHGDAVQYEFNERALIVLPANFSYVLTSQVLGVLYRGGTLYFFEEGLFSPLNFINYVNEHQITSTGLVSVHLRLLSKSNQYNSISSLKHICFVGGPTPNSIINRLKAKNNNVVLLQAYGLTEAGPRVAVQRFTSQLSEEPTYHSGPPIDEVLIEIKNSKFDKHSAKYIGEIYVKGPSIMKGYYKQEELTNKVLKGNWLYTGDLGYLDDENNLTLVGRKKNIIISMGKNIYPEEVEELLNSIPIVQDSRVYGMKDEIAGEVLMADIVLYEESNGNVDSIYSECIKKLSAYKIPKEINFVKKIARTKTGKIERVRG